MSWKSLLLLAIIGFVIFAQKRKWIDLTGNQRPSGNQIFGVAEELFAPAKHEARIVHQQRKEAPMRFNESDKPFDSAIKISLPKDDSQ